MIKKIIKLFIPKVLFYRLHAIKEYYYDIKRFVTHSNTYIKLNTQEKYNGYLTLNYHVIEKGLTMPETRLGFGKNVVLDLIEKCLEYQKKGFDLNSQAYIHTINVLGEYLEFHENHSFTLDDTITQGIKNVVDIKSETKFEGQLEFTSEAYFKFKDASFEQFCLSRHSARNFADKEVPQSVILKCIELANKSPSACNRQPSRVHIVNRKNTITDVLKLQSGNRGFGDRAKCILVVTSDLSAWQSHKERNEPAFNAGLFSMTLTYALHHYGLGSCLLNWSASKENDMALREIVHIPENEKITILIACGYVPEKFKIANSPRINPEEITTIES